MEQRFCFDNLVRHFFKVRFVTYDIRVADEGPPCYAARTIHRTAEPPRLEYSLMQSFTTSSLGVFFIVYGSAGRLNKAYFEFRKLSKHYIIMVIAIRLFYLCRRFRRRGIKKW